MESHTLCLFPTKLKIPCDSPHKSYLEEFFEISNLILTKILKFNPVPNGKMKNFQYLGNGHPYSKTE